MGTWTETPELPLGAIDRLLRTPPAYTAVTAGPGDEDWTVLDEDGAVVYVGPAILAARFAARFAA